MISGHLKRSPQSSRRDQRSSEQNPQSLRREQRSHDRSPRSARRDGKSAKWDHRPSGQNSRSSSRGYEDERERQDGRELVPYPDGRDNDGFDEDYSTNFDGWEKDQLLTAFRCNMCNIFLTISCTINVDLEALELGLASRIGVTTRLGV